MTVGILHPGAMGSAVASCITGRVAWASAGRSPATVARAAGLHDAGTIASLVPRCDVIVSLCPPEHAEAVATAVAGAGFAGTFVDANAIAPATARRIAARFDVFVDGGVIGPPPHRAGTTRLYLSGEAALAVAELFDGSYLEARVVPGGPGAASALKAAYAGWTKGSAALLLAVRAFADAEGVGQELLAEWELSQPGLADRAELAATGTAPKAWRFAGEMREIALAMAADGLPTGFHDASADIYARLADLRDLTGASLADVLGLLAPGEPRSLRSAGSATGATTGDR